MVLGMSAGFYGKRIDDTIMGLAELFLALPWLYALFALRAFLPLEMDPSVAFWFLSVAIGVVGWARPARLIRGEVLSAKEREYVLAARGFGASDIYLLRWHVAPQVKGILLTQASLLLPRYILAEVTMSFLGLGISEPRASWGNMLGALQQYNVLTSYWWIFLPAVGLIPTFLAYLAISDVLRMKT
jgi:peptide/nickel transport system permease protein